MKGCRQSNGPGAIAKTCLKFVARLAKRYVRLTVVDLLSRCNIETAFVWAPLEPMGLSKMCGNLVDGPVFDQPLAAAKRRR